MDQRILYPANSIGNFFPREIVDHRRRRAGAEHVLDRAPAIAGMSVDKFTKAIKEFQNGTRTKSAKMTKEAKKLSDADVANVAAYYSTLK